MEATSSTVRQLRTLQALLDLSTAMARPIQLNQLLGVIVEKTTLLLDAERSSLFLYDAEREELWSLIAEGITSQEIRFPISRGVAGHAARMREVVNIADAYEDPRFDRAVDRQTRFRTRAILCMPILSDSGELLGVIQVLNKQGDGQFDPDDQELLGALSAHIAVALERSRAVEAYAERKRMQEAMRLARDIQMSMLPTRLPSLDVERLIELHARMVPAQEVGGDFYDYFAIDEDRMGFAIGDVSGKGIPAALFMALSRSLLRSIAQTGVSPAECVRRVSAQLYESRPPTMFVTMVYGVLHLHSGEVEYCTAGHFPPVVVAGDGAVREMPDSGGLIACILPDFPFQSRRFVLEPDECLVLYTDGVSEAMSPEEEMPGDEGTVAWLATADERSARGVVDHVFRQLALHTRGAAQSDDVTMLVVKMLGAGNRRQIADERPAGAA